MHAEGQSIRKGGRRGAAVWVLAAAVMVLPAGATGAEGNAVVAAMPPDGRAPIDAAIQPGQSVTPSATDSVSQGAEKKEDAEANAAAIAAEAALRADAAAATLMPHKGFRLLEAESFGRFPTGIAIVRLDASIAGGDTERGVLPGLIPRYEAVCWNELADSLVDVREVCFPGSFGIPPAHASLKDVVRASLLIHCDLCLTYV
ncbi:MAG: hypothetical protein V3T70_07070, partial [Phycisphaerae bacterium]